MHDQRMKRSSLNLTLGLLMGLGALAHAADPAPAATDAAPAAASTDTPAPAADAATPAEPAAAPSDTAATTASSTTEPAAPAADTRTPDQKAADVKATIAASETKPADAKTDSMVPDASSASKALGQKSSDASAEKNLDQVFKATEKTYSLSKKGSYSASYDLDYTYYRDTRLDLALDDNSSSLRRLRIEDDAQHTITNTFDVQYGLMDNVTLTASLPLVAKADVSTGRNAVGLGDIAFGARWEPFPVSREKLPLTLFGSFSTKTGDSPFDINPLTDLATGKGYYSINGGASTRKYIDPIVLFGSISGGYGFDVSGLNQARGNRILTDFTPGVSGGISMGFAYSLNYDVSLTMSYQQSFAAGTEFKFSNGDVSRSADQTSATMNISMGVRVSPKTIVNGSLGFGLTEDAPDVSLGLSFPLDFLGFGREVK